MTTATTTPEAETTTLRDRDKDRIEFEVPAQHAIRFAATAMGLYGSAHRDIGGAGDGQEAARDFMLDPVRRREFEQAERELGNLRQIVQELPHPEIETTTKWIEGDADMPLFGRREGFRRVLWGLASSAADALDKLSGDLQFNDGAPGQAEEAREWMTVIAWADAALTEVDTADPEDD